MFACARVNGWVRAGAVAVGCMLAAAPARSATVAETANDVVARAYAETRAKPHRAAFDLNAELALRIPGVRVVGFSARYAVRQQVRGAAASGTIATRPTTDLLGLASGVTAARMVNRAGLGYLVAPRLSRRALRGEPADFGDLWLVTNPTSGFVRFPYGAVSPSYREVPSPDPAIRLMQAEIPERMAGRLIDGLLRGPGDGGTFKDEPLGPDTSYATRTATVEIDAATGRLRRTRIEVVLRIVAGDPDLIDTAVGDLTVRTVFVPSQVGTPVPRIRRPGSTTPIRHVIADLAADESARQLLAFGGLDMERLRARLETYRVTLRELTVVTDGITYTRFAGARAWRDEITAGRLSTDGYRLSTISASGRRFALERIPGVARLRGTCVTPAGVSCERWRPLAEIDGRVDGPELQLTSGISSLRNGVELLRHMGATAR